MSPDVTPHPKSAQLARGERRYRRKVASPKQWAAIRADKGGLCRVCLAPGSQLHHLISRAQGGDDIADNIVPLCAECHAAITERKYLECWELAETLSSAEYAYVVGKLGENALERLFGIGATR